MKRSYQLTDAEVKAAILMYITTTEIDANDNTHYVVLNYDNTQCKVSAEVKERNEKRNPIRALFAAPRHGLRLVRSPAR